MTIPDAFPQHLAEMPLAVHEAGHAVVAERLGLTFPYMSIDASEHGAGHVPVLIETPPDWTPRQLQHHRNCHGIVGFAGIAAEKLLGSAGRGPLEMILASQHDIRGCEPYLNGFKSRVAAYEHFTTEAERIVCENADQIMLVANILIKRRWLTQEQLRGLLAAHAADAAARRGPA